MHQEDYTTITFAARTADDLFSDRNYNSCALSNDSISESAGSAKVTIIAIKAI